MESTFSPLRRLSALLYLAVNLLFILKYVGRVHPSGAWVAALVYVVLAVGVGFLLLRHGQKLSAPWRWLLFSVTLLSMLALGMAQSRIDPYSLRVDRWSAIHNFLDHLFQGIYPYAAQTHLGGYGSPFPVWQLFHIPFWLLGNVGLSVFVAMLAFLGGMVLLRGVKVAFGALLLLLLSPAFLYEVMVRSDLMTNFLLVCSVLCLFIRYRLSFSAHWLWMAVLCGLVMSTRLSALIPFLVYCFRDYLHARWTVRLLFPLVMLTVFAATFLPFLLWDSEMLLFFEYNPFVLQSRQGHLADFLLFVPLGIWLSLSWKGDVSRFMLHTALLLIVLVFITFVHNMYLTDSWNQLFQSAYDITYFNMSMPFLIIAILPARP